MLFTQVLGIGIEHIVIVIMLLVHTAHATKPKKLASATGEMYAPLCACVCVCLCAPHINASHFAQSFRSQALHILDVRDVNRCV
jgi:hypothetical protein